MSVKTYPMPQFPKPPPITERDLAWAEALLRRLKGAR